MSRLTKGTYVILNTDTNVSVDTDADTICLKKHTIGRIMADEGTGPYNVEWTVDGETIYTSGMTREGTFYVLDDVFSHRIHMIESHVSSVRRDLDRINRLTNELASFAVGISKFNEREEV